MGVDERVGSDMAWYENGVLVFPFYFSFFSRAVVGFKGAGGGGEEVILLSRGSWTRCSFSAGDYLTALTFSLHAPFLTDTVCDFGCGFGLGFAVCLPLPSLPTTYSGQTTAPHCYAANVLPPRFLA